MIWSLIRRSSFSFCFSVVKSNISRLFTVKQIVPWRYWLQIFHRFKANLVFPFPADQCLFAASHFVIKCSSFYFLFLSAASYPLKRSKRKGWDASKIDVCKKEASPSISFLSEHVSLRRVSNSLWRWTFSSEVVMECRCWAGKSRFQIRCFFPTINYLIQMHI